MASHKASPTIRWYARTGGQVGFVNKTRRFLTEHDGRRYDLHHFCGSSKREIVGHYKTLAAAKTGAARYMGRHR